MSTITKEQVAQSFVDERLPKRSIVGYGLGDFGCNLAFTLGSTFLLYYYTDVAGLTRRRRRDDVLRRAALGRLRRPDRRSCSSTGR